ncbi:hypothetical protein XENORESO_003735 [Xenotaenia resolanae]|uniref:Uncharacterized protein n=1 Tax=Xenotaenia resolanae TaxID=208358 RepID=A0ABV0X7J4_9TELE
MTTPEGLFQSKAEHHPANYFHFHPGMYKRQQRNIDYKQHKIANLGPPLVKLPRKSSDSQEVYQQMAKTI